MPFLILLLITAGAVGFIYKDRIAKRMAGAQDKPATVSEIGPYGEARDAGNKPVSILAAKAELTDVPVYLHGVGTVQAFNRATVRAQVTGELLSVEFNEGDTVKQGQVLARIDPARYKAAHDQAVAKKAIDESALANALADLQRLETLAKSNFASDQAIDAQRAKADQLRAQIRQDQAAIDSARTDLDHTTIIAPIEGRTGIREIDAGNLISSTDLNGLVTISQLQPISVLFTLAENTVPDLIEAQKAGAVLLEARSGDRAAAQGTLSVIDSRIDQNTGTVRLKGTFANDPLTLWPGQFVNIRLHLKTLNGAVAVPIAALQQGATGRFVYRVAPDDTVRQTPVKVGYEDENRAVILSGLDAGSTVAVTGFNNLKDGAKISVDTGQGGNAAPKAPVSSKGEDTPADERKSENENGQPLKAAQRDTRG